MVINTVYLSFCSSRPWGQDLLWREGEGTTERGGIAFEIRGWGLFCISVLEVEEEFMQSLSVFKLFLCWKIDKFFKAFLTSTSTPWLLSSFDLPWYHLEPRKRYILRLLLICWEGRVGLEIVLPGGQRTCQEKLAVGGNCASWIS